MNTIIRFKVIKIIIVLLFCGLIIGQTQKIKAVLWSATNNKSSWLIQLLMCVL